MKKLLFLFLLLLAQIGFCQTWINNTLTNATWQGSPIANAYLANGNAVANLTGTNSGDVTLSGENYLSLSGQIITANAVNLSGSNVTGVLAAARFPALTGDVTTSSGAIATTIANSAVTLAKMADMATASLIYRKTAGTGAPEVNTLATLKTDLALVKADVGLGNVENTALSTGNALTATTLQNARTIAGTSFNGSANISLANKFIVQGTSDAGLSAAQFLGSLGTGIVKNTTTTGVLSIAVAGDFPTLNQNTTGTANISGGTAGAIPYQSSANTTTVLASTATANKPLMSGASAAPTWSTITIPNATGTVGQYAMSDGANMIWTDNSSASIVSASGAINTTETVIAKTPALAANRLLAGTVIRIVLFGTCTSTAANVSTFAVRIGTAGSTSDGLMESAATAVAATSGTSIPFRAEYEITIRTTGSSATSHGFCSLLQTGVTGIAAQTTQVIVPTFTSFNTTTASNIISVTYKSAATTTTCTFQDCYIEFVTK